MGKGKVIRLSDDCIEELDLVRQTAKLRHGKIIDSITDAGIIKLALEWYHNYLLFDFNKEDKK